MTLIGYMTCDPSPTVFDARRKLATWGDPAYGFVGDPDGRIEGYTGYGVYYQPVALATTLAGADMVQAGSGLYGISVPPQDVCLAVLTGHAVVAWISNTYHQVPLQHYIAYAPSATRWPSTR